MDDHAQAAALRRGHRPSMALVTVATLVLSFLVAPRFAVAADDAQAPQGNLPDGEWIGSMDASGVFTGAFDGVTVEVDVRVGGSIGFDVSQGAIDGEWSWTGVQVHDGDTPAGPLRAIFVSVADGPIGGSGRTLTMTGSQETNGTVFLAGTQQPVGPNVHSTGEVQVTVTFRSCGLVVGDWITPLEAISDTTGLQGSLSGSFAAAHQGDASDSDLLERLQRFRVDMNAWEGDWLETGTPDPEVGNSLASRAVALAAEAAVGADECLFDAGTDRDDFDRLLSAELVTLVRAALTTVELPASNLDAVVSELLEFGLIGSGAGDQDTAQELTELVRDQVERLISGMVLTEGTAPNGASCSQAAPCVGFDPEARHALRVASRLGLTVEVAGIQGDAQAILDHLAEAGTADEEDGA